VDYPKQNYPVKVENQEKGNKPAFFNKRYTTIDDDESGLTDRQFMVGSALRVYDTIPQKYMKMKTVQEYNNNSYVKKNTNQSNKPSAL